MRSLEFDVADADAIAPVGSKFATAETLLGCGLQVVPTSTATFGLDLESELGAILPHAGGYIWFCWRVLILDSDAFRV